MPYLDPDHQRASNRRSYARHKEKVKARVADYKKIAKQRWQDYKDSLQCAHCGETDSSTFDFHHVVHTPTNRKVHELIRNKAYKAAREELKKCIVLCSNCHRKEHKRLRGE